MFLSYLCSCAKKTTTHFSTKHNDTCILVNINEKDQKLLGALSITIVYNNLDDTAIVYSIKVPPKKTGEFFYMSDFYNNDIKLCFEKFKAKNGGILIACEL